MEYTTRNLESDPGMSQAEALVSLQKDASWSPDHVISGIHKRGNQWVAEVLVPKTAEFPPKDEGGGEEEAAPSKPEPKSDGGDEGGGGDSAPSDGPPSDGGDKKPDGAPGDKAPKGDEAILHVLTQILHALGGGAPMGGPDALGPGGPPGATPPPPKAPAGPPGAGGPPGAPKFAPRPMKPGDTPPGGTPVGAPAFSSVQDLRNKVASYSGKASTITITTAGGDIKAAVEVVRPTVENFGYKVKQAKYGDNGEIHILASRR